MSWARDGFFFYFSDTATNEYKDELKSILTFYDGFSDAKTYTPYAAGIAGLLIAGVQTALGNNSSYSLFLNSLLIFVPAAQVGVMALANVGINNFANKGNRLIEQGERNKFFKDVPDKLPTTETSDEATLINVTQPDVHADAMKYRILGRR